MEDTLLVGDRLFASKFIYGVKIPFSKVRLFKIRDPKPGDIIVFKYPQDPSKDYIKRCIAVGGQKVEIVEKNVFVDGVKQTLPKHSKFIDSSILPSEFGPRDTYPLTKITEENLFAMGDNRDNSEDSRVWGFASRKAIRGRAMFIWISLSWRNAFTPSWIRFSRFGKAVR